MRFQVGLVVAIAGSSLGLASCSGEREVAGPGPPGGEPARLIVKVLPGPGAEDLSGRLSWEGGVPGAQVHFLRIGTAEWTTRITDPEGVLSIPLVLAGAYRVYASRMLTPSEAETAGGVVRMLGDGTTVQAQGGDGAETEVVLELSIDRSGDLLISEVSGWSPPPWETNGGYLDAMYFEVFNNNDAVLFLDGIVFGSTIYAGDTVGGHCEQSQGIRGSPGGVLATQMIAFPGSGAEFPIGPGETRLVAVSAIDHSFVHPHLFDLSHADFEIGSAAGVDNPAVPDMVDVGLQPFVLSLGGGSHSPLISSKRAYFLADPQVPTDLPIVYRDFTGRGYVQVPAETLIDVSGLTIVWPDSDREFPPCVPMVHDSFDRYEGGYLPIALGVEGPRLSFQRQILRSDGGRPILLDTNTSAVDYVVADVTPGELPPP